MRTPLPPSYRPCPLSPDPIRAALVRRRSHICCVVHFDPLLWAIFCCNLRAVSHGVSPVVFLPRPVAVLWVAFYLSLFGRPTDRIRTFDPILLLCPH